MLRLLGKRVAAVPRATPMVSPTITATMSIAARWIELTNNAIRVFATRTEKILTEVILKNIGECAKGMVGRSCIDFLSIRFGSAIRNRIEVKLS